MFRQRDLLSMEEADCQVEHGLWPGLESNAVLPDEEAMLRVESDEDFAEPRLDTSLIEGTFLKQLKPANTGV